MPAGTVFPLRSCRDQDSGRVIDLVVFFRYVYDYWYYGGKWNAMVARIVDLANCVVLWLLVFVSCFMVEWGEALSCEGSACAQVQLIRSPAWPEKHNLAAFVLVAACGAACLWELRRVIEGHFLFKEVHVYLKHDIRVGNESPMHQWLHKARVMYHQYREGAHHEIGGMDDADDDEEFEDIGRPLAGVEGHYNRGQNGAASGSGGLGSGQRGGAFRARPSIRDISWSDYLRIVVRKAQSDKGITGYRAMDELKVIQTMMLLDNYHTALHHHGVLSQVPLCFADANCINFLIDTQMQGYRIRQGEEAEKKLKEKLFVRTLLYFLAYPFVVSFMLTKFLVKSVAEYRTNPHQLFERQWSATASWRFRLYNEVPHLAQARIRKGNDVALEIIRKASGVTESPFLRVLQRSSASALLVIVVATTLNTPLLNYGMLFDRTLVWWLSLAIFVFGLSTGSMVVDREYCHKHDLERLAGHLHYDRPCCDALKHLTAFMQRHHTVVDGVGSVCTASTFMLRGGLDSTHGSTDLIGSSASPVVVSTAGAGTAEEDANKTDSYQSMDHNNVPCAAVGGAGSTAMDQEMTETGGGSQRKSPIVEGAAGKTQKVPPLSLPTTATRPPSHHSPLIQCFEWKVEKSLVSFASIYPSWLERLRATADSDELGIIQFLADLEQRILDDQTAAAEQRQMALDEAIASGPFPTPRGPAPAAQQQQGPTTATGTGGESRPTALMLSSAQPSMGVFSTTTTTAPTTAGGRDAQQQPQNLFASTAHDREAANVGMVDALYRSTWMDFAPPSTAGANSSADNRRRGGVGTAAGGLAAMGRIGSYGSGRDREDDLTLLLHQ